MSYPKTNRREIQIYSIFYAWEMKKPNIEIDKITVQGRLIKYYLATGSITVSLKDISRPGVAVSTESSI